MSISRPGRIGDAGLCGSLAFAAITALYLALRWAVFGALAKPWPHAPAFVASVPSLPVAFATYLQLLLWPAGFSIFRPERPVWHALDGRVVAHHLEASRDRSHGHRQPDVTLTDYDDTSTRTTDRHAPLVSRDPAAVAVRSR